MTINNAVLEKVQNMGLKPTTGDVEQAAQEVASHEPISADKLNTIYTVVKSANYKGLVTYESLIVELTGRRDELVTQAAKELRFQLRQREEAVDTIAEKAAEILLSGEQGGVKMTIANAICLAQYPEHILDAIRDEVDRIVGSQ